MSTRAARLVGWCVAAAAVTSAHDIITTPITFSREISRIVYARCASCHRPGGSAFSLMTYADARPWAAAIKEEVLERRMPPWGAVKGFGEFRDDQGLTQEQIEVIADWVEGGAPEGDAKLLPEAPEFPSPRSRRMEDGLRVDASLVLRSRLDVAGIRPEAAPEDGSSVFVTARRPDGSVEPLLWLYGYKARFQRVYWYRKAVRLPAGSRIEVAPPHAATVALMAERPGR